MRNSVHRAWPFAFLLLLNPILAPAQSQIAQVPSPLSLDVNPAFDLPVGDTSNWFSYGGGVDLDMNFRIPGSVFFLTGGIEYAYAPTQAANSVSLAVGRAGGGLQLALTKGISILGFGAGGYYFGTFNNFTTSATDPYVAGGIGLKFSLSSSLTLNVEAQYEDFLGLYQGLSAGAGIGIALGNFGGSADIPRVNLRPAFPVFYKYYDDHPIGSLELKSSLKVPATGIRAQVYIKEFMDAPKVVEVPGALAPGAIRTIDLYALFTDKVLNGTEGTKVAAEISVDYMVDGQVYEDRKIETVTLLGRNAMTWDDNRKAAAYVSSKDPGVLNFARSVTSFVQGRENRSINDNLQAAIALHEALDIYGLNYSTNQRTPYSEVSKQKDVIDFVQFPRETFQYHAGDCSDISILYGALLESVGIATAFITIPGHIFIAFDTGLTPEQASQALVPPGQVVSYKGKAWIPVEVTSIHGGFLKAWDLGAKEWNENTQQGLAGFYPIEEAWGVYQSVGLPGTETTLTVPQSSSVLAAYQSEVQKFIDTAIGPQVSKLQDQIKSSGSFSARNNLGVLYAKYGQADKAEQEFKDILSSKKDLPAMLNLGHLYFAREDWTDALALYQQASELSPANARVLLALARVNLEMKHYDDAKADYERLKSLDPTLANQFAYLGQGTETGARAANVESERGAIIWESDE